MYTIEQVRIAGSVVELLQGLGLTKFDIQCIAELVPQHIDVDEKHERVDAAALKPRRPSLN